jgi:hypothetical protein
MSDNAIKSTVQNNVIKTTVQNNVIKTKSPKRQKLTCIICNQQLSITDNDHKCSYRILSQHIILNK